MPGTPPLVSRCTLPFVLAGSVLLSAPASAQSASSALAQDLAGRLQAAGLDAIAAKDPESGRYAAVLFLPGVQMLVVSAEYSAPAVLDELLASENYRDVYVNLNSGFVPGTRIFIEDRSSDGLREDATPPDAFQNGTGRTVFDGSAADGLLEEADAEYARILEILASVAR